QVEHLLRRRPRRPGQGHAALRRDPRIERHPSAAGGGLRARRAGDRRPAAVRRVRQRVPDPDDDLRPPALAGAATGLRPAGRLRRPAAAPAGHDLRRADRSGAPGRCLVGAHGAAPDAGAGGRPVPTAAAGRLVPARRGAAGMTAPLSLVEAMAGQDVDPDGYARLEVGDAVWEALAAGCAAGRHDLSALWADEGLVRMALSDSERALRAIVSLRAEAGVYPSVARHHAPALRLERAMRDLRGTQPVGLPDPRPWLDHGRWPGRE